MSFEDLLLNGDVPGQSLDALAGHYELYPLNRMLLAGQAEELLERGTDISTRVKFRRAVKNLLDSGLAVAGPGSQIDRFSAQIQISVAFTNRGQLRELPTFDVRRADDPATILALTQSALQEQGLPMVVDIFGDMHLVGLLTPDGLDEEQLDCICLNCFYTEETPVRDFRQWMAVDKNLFRNGMQLRQWQQLGIEPEQAGRWLALDSSFQLISNVSRWVTAGYSPEQAREWIAAHRDLADYRTAERWMRQDLGLTDARNWASIQRYNLSSLVSAAAQIKQQDAAPSDIELIARAIERSRITPHDLAQMLRCEVSLQHILDLLRQTALRHRLADWASMGLSCTEAEQWASVTRDDPTAARAWIEAGFGIEQAEAWRAAGAADARSALSWLQAGYDPEQAGPWLKASRDFGEHQQARPWIELGLAASQAGEWQRHGFSADQAADWVALGDEFSEVEQMYQARQRGLNPSSIAWVRNLSQHQSK